jgi:HSP20 family protein
MQLTQWSPFRDMDDFFHQFRRGFGHELPALSGDGAGLWAPVVDISEGAGEYRLRAELPGLSKDAVKITVEDGVLTLSGERRIEHSDEKRHRTERAYGSFTRSFALPADVVEDRIAADYKDGVLCVHLPRAEQKKPKPIEVRVQ